MSTTIIPDKCENRVCLRLGDDRDRTLYEDPRSHFWLCPACGASYGEGRKFTLQEKLHNELKSQDYRPAEDFGAAVGRLMRLSAKLGAALVQKGVFTEEEMIEVFEDI